MIVAFTAWIYRIELESEAELMAITFAAFATIAAFIALTTTRQSLEDRQDARATQNRIEAHLRRIEELLEQANELAKQSAPSPSRRSPLAFLAGMILGRVSK